MKTLIFKDYDDFFNRENRGVNGVSEDFAKENPNYEKDNETNTGCWNCSDCSDCRYCLSCRFSSDCSYCSYCLSCRFSSACHDCHDCSDCRYCRSCSDCHDCRSCSDCSDCRSCSDCSDFSSNPQRIVSKKLGSRYEQTTYYWNEEKDQIVCGCYTGTLEDFEARVMEAYGSSEGHGADYLAWIESVKAYKLNQ